MPIDLNCDLGEGCPHDAELMSLITSANISCGAYAGNAGTMAAALMMAKRSGVQVGAHVGFRDREHFGRLELQMDEDDVFQDCHRQIRALTGLANIVNWPLRYVKPHGGLYHLACREPAYAEPVVRAAEQASLAVLSLPDSALSQAARKHKLGFVAEGFADRRYLPDGSLVPRDRPGALIEDPQEAVQQADWLVRERKVESICVHGDNPQAVAFVRKLRELFLQRGVEIMSFTV